MARASVNSLIVIEQNAAARLASRLDTKGPYTYTFSLVLAVKIFSESTGPSHNQKALDGD